MAEPELVAADRRRFHLAAGGGAAIAVVVFLAFLTSGPFGFFESLPFGMGGFYDEQTRALFDGRWDAAPDAFFIERINVDGAFYMYFGPWPSVLRMPILALTDSLDGELTRLSLLVAHLVLFAGLIRVMWDVRTVTRGTIRPGRRELIGVAGFTALVGCGSTVLFMSASGWVYDEAILWGTALAMWTMHFVLRHLASGSGRTLIAASGFATLAILSRVSSGMIGVLALGAIAAVQLSALVPTGGLGDRLARLRRASGVGAPVASRAPWATLGAALAPLAAMAAVNVAKYGSMFDVPFENQDLVIATLPERQGVLDANGNGLVALNEIPTNVVHYLRPDAVDIDPLFPFFDFSDGPSVIGDVARDPEGLSTSLTASTTVLLALAIVGLAGVFVPAVARSLRFRAPGRLRIPLLASLIAFGPALMFPAVSERYKMDLTVLLVVAGAAGLFAVASAWRGSTATRRVVTAGLVALALLNVGVNAATTLHFQRGYQGLVPPAERAAFLADRIDTTETFGLEPAADVIDWDGSDPQPAAGPVGSFLRGPDCGSLALSDGRAWLEIAATDAEPLCAPLAGN